MINKYICAGYLSSDPKSQTFSSGKMKCTFSLGVNAGKETTWIDVECWDKIAENSNSLLKKGSLILLEGKLKYLSWTDKNNFKKNKLICVCDFFKLLPSGNSNQSDEHQNNKPEVHNVQNIINSDLNFQEEEDNIPW